jgi:hypothetical protein
VTRQLSRHQLAVPTLVVAAAVFFAGAGVAAQGTAKVGDRVIISGYENEKGTIKEIGSGDRAGCYFVQWDYQKKAGDKGGWVCTYGQVGRLLVLDAAGGPPRDVNDTAGTKPEVRGDNPLPAQNNAEGRNAPTPNPAQAPREGFKAGDRVEQRTNAASKWEDKCTVVVVKPNGDHVLRCDDKPLEEQINSVYNLRLLQGPDDGGKQAADAARRTLDQAAAQCSGEPLLNLRTKGRAASRALFMEVIKALYDKAPNQFGEGKTVTTITSLQVGASYRWRPGLDWQLLGTKPKTVFPVKVRLSYCADFETEYRITERVTDEVYSCYVDDGFGEWKCSIKDVGTNKTYTVRVPAHNDLNTGRRPRRP